MDFDFYLSEMSVSDFHGGGLTLQRIIGEDLERIPHFVHVTRFGTDLPANEKFAEKIINLVSFWEADGVRKKIGNSLAAAINRHLLIIKVRALKNARALNKVFGSQELVRGLVCPQGANSLYTMEALKRWRHVKYVTWIMDDHLVQFHNGNWRYPGGIEQIFKKHLKEAEHVFVISPVMHDFYLERFGVESTVLFGSSDLNPEINRNSQEGALKIGYFGAVASWQVDALKIVADALAANEAELHIYSGIEKLPVELQSDGVYLQRRLNPGAVLPAMKNYDAILLPISFLNKLRSMSEFNIATKMSECLASGVPVLAVGPEYAAMIRYLKTSNSAVLIRNDEEEDIHRAFELLRDKNEVAEILVNAKNLVMNEIGTVPMRKRWLDAVNNL